MYHCDDCGREGTPRMVGRALVCFCGSVELRWLPSPATPAAGLAERYTDAELVKGLERRGFVLTDAAPPEPSEGWTLGRTRRAARRRERRTLRARPWRRLRRRMRGWFGRLVDKLLRGATIFVEALELANERRRLLRVLLERPPVEELAAREARAAYDRIGRRIFGAAWQPPRGGRAALYDLEGRLAVARTPEEREHAWRLFDDEGPGD